MLRVGRGAVPGVASGFGLCVFEAWGNYRQETGRPSRRPVIVSDRLFLSGLLASIARLRFTGWERSCRGRSGLSIAEKKKREGHNR